MPASWQVKRQRPRLGAAGVRGQAEYERMGAAPRAPPRTMTRIYLSGPKRLREDLRGYRVQIVALGHDVNAGWLDRPPILEDDDDTPATADSTREDHGEMSFSDAHDVKGAKTLKSRRMILRGHEAATRMAEIIDSELFVVFTDAQNHTREEAYGEYVGALFRGQKVWIVGERYHTFHCYSDVPQFSDFAAFLVALKGLAAAERTIASQTGQQAAKQERPRGGG